MDTPDIIASLRKRPDAATEGKRLIIRLFDEFFNQHDMSAVDRYMHPDYIQHDFDVPPASMASRPISPRCSRCSPTST